MNKKELKKQEQERLQKEYNELINSLSKQDRKLNSDESLKENEKIIEFNEDWALLHFDFDLYLKMINENDEMIRKARKRLYRDLIVATDIINVYDDRLKKIDYTNKTNLKKIDEEKYDFACRKKERVLRDLDSLENNPHDFLKKSEELYKKIAAEKENLHIDFDNTSERYDDLFSRRRELTDLEKKEYHEICVARNEIIYKDKSLDADPEEYFKKNYK